MTTLFLLGRQLLAALAVVFCAATLTFAGLSLSGGDVALEILGGPDALPTPQALAQVRRDYGLDQPVPVQYLRYLGRLAHGDLGESYRLHAPVAGVIAQQLAPTLQLAACAALLSVLLALATALATAGRGRRWRGVASGTELLLSSMPGFVVGILLLLAFSFTLHWFPASGGNGWRSLVLPAVTLALPLAAQMAQVLRQQLDAVLEQPFITMARARGLGEAGVRLRHALRHALLPLLTLSGFIFSTLLGGAVVTELLFARQGIGRLVADAASGKDIPLVLGITLLAALAYAVINMLTDACCLWLDPRLRVRAVH
jgi:peptide/nickel transport system permease protein